MFTLPARFLLAIDCLLFVFLTELVLTLISNCRCRQREDEKTFRKVSFTLSSPASEGLCLLYANKGGNHLNLLEDSEILQIVSSQMEKGNINF